MQKCLFLLCPTDCLESIIDNRFKYENYFYTSLGNSFIYDRVTIEYIKGIVKKHDIRDIYFVLSADNQIIIDALGNQDFSDIRKLNHFYKEIITNQQKHSETLRSTGNLKFSVLSYYLNIKIKRLQQELNNLPNHPVKIRGKIYDRYDNMFRAIYSDLICLEKYRLN